MNFCSHLVQLPGWTKYLGKWASHKLHIEYSIRYSGSCLHRFDLFWIQQILCMLLYQFFSENGPQWIHMKFFLNYLSSADIKCDILISKHMLIHGFMVNLGVGTAQWLDLLLLACWLSFCQFGTEIFYQSKR